MATITITIPDAAINRVQDAFATHFRYDLNGGGLTKAQFAKAQLIAWVKRIVAGVEGGAADDTARASAQSIDIT